ncbi:hypothetical protein V4E86_31540 [Burkholderia pseudomallei]|uniref:Uncharacterized protein n=4 Tax=Burkholderia pseudomallei TaxID=28450 RepID=A0A0H3I1Z4_BURP2|nr:hypothetical protein [Burkholderia pseudomallei]EIF55924.1 hypothetical protein BP1258A_4614 [Burkholderia pseudomallei 1258a]ABN88298.1 conserved hypothetical protein [Burkholderia pseudomallei 668]ABN94034.1 conserved hypothetical protein [Burkholderia pseudomallei 1106a]AFI70366.1 hypothetical protein BP1026B_II2141 [Burkholderia pseudomallei 1026b]ARK45448.1 hypothetical protein BOC35_02955 [Burkholderia pseudomallei]
MHTTRPPSLVSSHAITYSHTHITDWFSDATFYRGIRLQKSNLQIACSIMHTEMLNCERHAFSKKI